MKATILALFLCVSFVITPKSSVRAEAVPVRALQLGDSITLRCQDDIQRYNIAADGYVGRQFYQGVGILLSMYGGVPPTVIIELGTNGRPGRQNIYAMMGALRQARHVFFVTVKEPRPWESKTNEDLRYAAQHWRKVHLIKWHGYAYGHPGWLEDGIHPTPIGCRKLAYLENYTLRYYGL